MRAQDFILKKGLHNYSRSIDAHAATIDAGVPIGVGKHAPLQIGNTADFNNFLDDGSDDLAYGTEPEGNEDKKLGALELP